MQVSQPADVQDAFRALADPTRRDILVMLSEQEMTIAQVSDRFDMTRSAVKKHLSVLETGNLISVKTKGRERINQLAPTGLKAVHEWISHFDQFWENRLGKLQEVIETHTQSES